MKSLPHLLLALAGMTLAACDRSPSSGGGESSFPNPFKKATPVPTPMPTPVKKTGEWMFDKNHKTPLDPPTGHDKK